jgi:NADPH:quinone reductase-like Zn-dependent oxidoreductase
MKAMVYHKYGTPDELKFEEVSKPSPKDDEVLVKVKASSINKADTYMLKGEPFLIRLENGFTPKKKILGADVAGQVKAVGKGVNVLRLETGIHQTEAIGLYESFGFVQIPPFGDYKEDPLSRFYEIRL